MTKGCGDGGGPLRRCSHNTLRLLVAELTLLHVSPELGGVGVQEVHDLIMDVDIRHLVVVIIGGRASDVDVVRDNALPGR